MFKSIAVLKSLWAAYKWLAQTKKQVEADTDAYLSEERARKWRLNLEKAFRALAAGDVKKLPGPLQTVCGWLFERTDIDNSIGKFGQMVLKSNKLATDHPLLKHGIE